MKTDVQPEVNIGLVGHVDHGKTTLTEALSGERADRHSEEVKRGISIRLGYADTTFYKCKKCKGSLAYATSPECPNCGGKAGYLRAVSFVDAPGHETLMATMLSGAAIMNGAILLVAANERCPQPQTKEHLMALSIAGLQNIIIVQNKIDLVSKEDLIANYKQIKAFTKGTIAENAPIIPVSAQQRLNIDVLIEQVEKIIPSMKFDSSKPARMFIARSFDINKPGARPKDLNGGVLGGSLNQGSLCAEDDIEIKPGVTGTDEGYVTKVTTVFSGGNVRDEVRPGGLIAVGTLLDPYYTKSDSMCGKVLGKPGTLPPVWDSLTMETHLLATAVGTEKDITVDAIKTGEPLMLNIGTATTVGVVTSARDDTVDVKLKISVCAEKEQRIAISRRISQKFRLIGHGVIK